jgi:hypothetical protein
MTFPSALSSPRVQARRTSVNCVERSPIPNSPQYVGADYSRPAIVLQCRSFPDHFAGRLVVFASFDAFRNDEPVVVQDGAGNGIIARAPIFPISSKSRIYSTPFQPVTYPFHAKAFRPVLTLKSEKDSITGQWLFSLFGVPRFRWVVGLGGCCGRASVSEKNLRKM